MDAFFRLKQDSSFDGPCDLSDNFRLIRVSRVTAAPPGPGHPLNQGLTLGQLLPARTALKHRSRDDDLARLFGPWLLNFQQLFVFLTHAHGDDFPGNATFLHAHTL